MALPTPAPTACGDGYHTVLFVLEANVTPVNWDSIPKALRTKTIPLQHWLETLGRDEAAPAVEDRLCSTDASKYGSAEILRFGCTSNAVPAGVEDMGGACDNVDPSAFIQDASGISGTFACDTNTSCAVRQTASNTAGPDAYVARGALVNGMASSPSGGAPCVAQCFAPATAVPSGGKYYDADGNIVDASPAGMNSCSVLAAGESPVGWPNTWGLEDAEAYPWNTYTPAPYSEKLQNLYDTVKTCHSALSAILLARLMTVTREAAQAWYESKRTPGLSAPDTFVDVSFDGAPGTPYDTLPANLRCRNVLVRGTDGNVAYRYQSTLMYVTVCVSDRMPKADIESFNQHWVEAVAPGSGSGTGLSFVQEAAVAYSASSTASGSSSKKRTPAEIAAMVGVAAVCVTALFLALFLH